MWAEGEVMTGWHWYDTAVWVAAWSLVPGVWVLKLRTKKKVGGR